MNKHINSARYSFLEILITILYREEYKFCISLWKKNPTNVDSIPASCSNCCIYINSLGCHTVVIVTLPSSLPSVPNTHKHTHPHTRGVTHVRISWSKFGKLCICELCICVYMCICLYVNKCYLESNQTCRVRANPNEIRDFSADVSEFT